MGVRSDRGRPRHILVEVLQGAPLGRGALQRLLSGGGRTTGPAPSLTVVAPRHFLVRTTHWDAPAVRELLEGTLRLEGKEVRMRTVRTSGTIASLRPLLPPPFNRRGRHRKGGSDVPPKGRQQPRARQDDPA